MLSPEDVARLITTCKNNLQSNNLPGTDAFGVMISSEGIAAITVTDPNIVNDAALNIQFSDFRKNYEIRSERILIDSSLNVQERKEKLQKMFLSILPEALKNKIGLLEGEQITSPNGNKFIKWTNITLDSNNELTKTPC
jgi:hypothetical protein